MFYFPLVSLPLFIYSRKVLHCVLSIFSAIYLPKSHPIKYPVLWAFINTPACKQNEVKQVAALSLENNPSWAYVINIAPISALNNHIDPFLVRVDLPFQNVIPLESQVLIGITSVLNRGKRIWGWRLVQRSCQRAKSSSFYTE